MPSQLPPPLTTKQIQTPLTTNQLQRRSRLEELRSGGLRDHCYVAGPMRGKPYWNRDAFAHATRELREAGWKVVNPHEVDAEHGIAAPADGSGTALKDYPIGEDLKTVAQSDAVFVLSGWEQSQGARLEVHVAHELGVKVYEIETLEEVQQSGEAAPVSDTTIPNDSAERKNIPIVTGVIDYFPAALAEVAKVSKYGNDKHNPGEPLHWARGKSKDQADAIGRHLIDRGGIDPDTGMRHSAELAWRALALLQLELEKAGEAPLSRGSRT